MTHKSTSEMRTSPLSRTQITVDLEIFVNIMKLSYDKFSC